MKIKEVVAAIIMYNDEILCMQRGLSKYSYLSYKYEFPGGKVEDGETYVEALQRELIEEMDLSVTINEANHFMTVQHTYPDFTITMHSYICFVPSRAFVQKEHVAHQWLKKEELRNLEWAAADWPMVQKLMNGS